MVEKMPWGKNKENVSPEEINVKIYLWRKLTEIGNYDRFINHSGQQNSFRYNFNENISITDENEKMFFSRVNALILQIASFESFS